MTAERAQHVSAFLTAVAAKLKYPPNYNWNNESAPDATEFQEFRKVYVVCVCVCACVHVCVCGVCVCALVTACVSTLITVS